jgi:hypothetical protein
VSTDHDEELNLVRSWNIVESGDGCGAFLGAVLR